MRQRRRSSRRVLPPVRRQQAKPPLRILSACWAFFNQPLVVLVLRIVLVGGVGSGGIIYLKSCTETGHNSAKPRYGWVPLQQDKPIIEGLSKPEAEVEGSNIARNILVPAEENPSSGVGNATVANGLKVMRQELEAQQVALARLAAQINQELAFVEEGKHLSNPPAPFNVQVWPDIKVRYPDAIDAIAPDMFLQIEEFYAELRSMNTQLDERQKYLADAMTDGLQRVKRVDTFIWERLQVLPRLGMLRIIADLKAKERPKL